METLYSLSSTFLVGARSKSSDSSQIAELVLHGVCFIIGAYHIAQFVEV